MHIDVFDEVWQTTPQHHLGLIRCYISWDNINVMKYLHFLTYLLRRKSWGISYSAELFPWSSSITTFFIWCSAMSSSCLTGNSAASFSKDKQPSQQYNLDLAAAAPTGCHGLFVVKRPIRKRDGRHCEPCNLHMNDSGCKRHFINHAKSVFR